MCVLSANGAVFHLILSILTDSAVYPNFDLYPPLPNAPVLQSQRMTRSTSRLTHLELHAMVMMERSFGPIDPKNGLRERIYQIPVTLEDEDAGILAKLPDSSFRASGTQKPLTVKPGTTNLVRTFRSFDETTLSSGISTHWEVSRPSSIPSTSTIFHGSPIRTTPARPDSLVLQRVKAFDNNCEYDSSYKRPHYLTTLLDQFIRNP